MPTHDETDEFLRMYHTLNRQQRNQFAKAFAKMVEDLKAGRPFRKSLRVKHCQSKGEGVLEMTWAGDGRALFRFGTPVRGQQPHVIWLAIGGHEILD